MQINPQIFRGYDLRGIAGKDLNPEIVECLGQAYGTFLARRGIKKTVVGHDCRLTSESYSAAIIKGLLASGVDVVDIGLALAGNVYWAQYYFEASGCVSVSASHNPAEFNGFKFGKNYSLTLVSDEIQELRQITETEEFVKGQGSLKKEDIRTVYFDDLVKRFNTPFRFKVIIDPSHSTPGVFVPELLEQAGCEVVCANCELDGSFPLGTPDPTENIIAQRIARKVISEKADLGLSYDSDGDRIGLVDDKGHVVWNDVLVALFAIDVLAVNPGAPIVFNSLCSKLVPETISAYHGQPLMWRTGHSFIKAKAQQEKAAFAGELSGHFFFLDKFYPHDDGCYSTLRLLNYLQRSGKTLSQAVGGLPRYISSPEIKIGCPDEIKVGLMVKISEKLRQDFSGAQIIDDERVGDGVRLDESDSMIVIRYSQNGPYLTVKFEARTQPKYDEIRDYLKQLLHSYSEIDWSFGVNVESLN